MIFDMIVGDSDRPPLFCLEFFEDRLDIIC